MHLDSVEDLISTLRGCGLFGPEQSDALARELAPLGGDVSAVMKYLVKTDRVSLYQLKKILHGKAAELFIGSYVVTDKLGSGGMGKVYRARDAANGRTVALKVVRAGLIANPTVRGRYAREVQATHTLDHPNIVRLFDSGEADGKFYLAMEFVDGIDLARLMRDSGAVEVPEACEYVRQAALGLRHAHDRGFVHRDIKPSNIVVAGARHWPQAGEPAVVKILDLGLARAIDPDDMVAPDLTRDHTVVGTPDYMAPEQARHSKHPDPRSDLYSLGCTFYFLLTGRVPFPVPGAIQKILAHQSEQPSPVQALRPDVPTEVAVIAARLMTKRPEDRIQTAGELAALLGPHALYPAGAAPVVPKRHDADAAPPRGPVESGRGAFPSSAGSLGSLGSFSPLELSDDEHTPPRAARPAPVAPSDDTPRPPAPAPVPPVVRKSSDSTVPPRKRRHPRRRPPLVVPQIVWLVVALAGIAILAVMLWLLARQ